MTDTSFDQIEYRFRDSSVAPQYHRSYVISITQTACHINVNSYGNTLADQTYPLSADAWEKLNVFFKQAEPEGEYISQGLQGGKTYSIYFHKEDKPLYRLVWDSKYKALQSNTEELISFIKSLVPNLSELTKK